MSALLREARHARGWSSARMRREMTAAARHLKMAIASDSSLRVLISRWENGRAAPDPDNLTLLEAVLGLPADALGFAAPDPAETADVSALVRHARRRLDPPPALLDYFTAQLAEHARFDNLAGPSYILATAVGQLDQIEQLVDRGGPEIAHLAARFAEFAGWLMQDSGDDTQALRLTERSVDYADAAGDAELATYNLMRKANVLTTLGQAQLAATTARKALASATERFPALVPVCLRQHALATSRQRDERSTYEAIETALTLTNTAVAADGLSPYCTRSYVQMEAALCLLLLRQPAAAEQACTSALADWPDGLVRDRTLCLARRGMALVELREVDEACVAAMLALDGVRAAPSGRTIHLLRVIARRLRPFNRNPSVRELTAALAEVA
jgi:transcriptional regulator with XRE-family HTH domain